MTIEIVVNIYYINATYNNINTIYIKMYQKIIQTCYFCYTNNLILLNFKLNVPIYLKQINKTCVSNNTT